jgi:multidrug resistance protein, MATE family
LEREAKAQDYARFKPDRVATRALLQLALPIVVVQAGIMLMGVVDTIIVGHLSAEALGAVALGNMYFFSMSIFGMGVLMALDPIISQAVGAQDEPAIGHAMQRAFVISILLAALVSGFMLLAPPILRFLQQPDEIIPNAALFCRIMIPGVLPMLAFTVLRQSLQSMTVVAPIVIGIVLANLLNAALNWVLVFGNLGAPAMGVAGSAWATSISRIALFLVVLVAAWPRLRAYLGSLRAEAFELGPMLRMLRLGTPIGFHYMLEYGAFAAIMVLMGRLGTIEVASHSIAINLASLTFMVPFGISQAASVLVGQAVGRGQPPTARRAAGAAIAAGLTFMAGSGLAMLAVPRVFASIYTSDPAVLALGAVLIRIAGVFQVFDGLQVVCAGILRGVGDTRVPMVLGLVGFWAVGIPISAYLGLATAAGAVGLWWGIVAGLAAVALLLLARAYLRLSGNLDRVVIEDVPAVTA